MARLCRHADLVATLMLALDLSSSLHLVLGEGDDLLHHVGVDFRDGDNVRPAGRLEDPGEHGGPGLQDDGVAVEPTTSTLETDIGVLPGTEAAQGTQQPLGFLTAKKL